MLKYINTLHRVQISYKLPSGLFITHFSHYEGSSDIDKMTKNRTSNYNKIMAMREKWYHYSKVWGFKFE